MSLQNKTCTGVFQSLKRVVCLINRASGDDGIAGGILDCDNGVTGIVGGACRRPRSRSKTLSVSWAMVMRKRLSSCSAFPIRPTRISSTLSALPMRQRG
jgi:hypothetical protein